MRRLAFAALLVAACLAVAAGGPISTGGGATYRLLGFYSPTVIDTSQTVLAFEERATLIVISNDGTSPVYLRFGDGDVDTTSGTGGGWLEAGEQMEFPILTSRLALKCGSGSAATRIWVYGP